MSAADARASLEAVIERAMDSAVTCDAGHDCPDSVGCPCTGALNVAMAQATVYAEQYAAEAIEKALAPYRLRGATAEHSPPMGRRAT